MNYGDTQQGLNTDIDEHLSKEEANDRAEEKREQFIEGNLQEYLKDPGMFQEFLKECASEYMNDTIHRAIVSDMKERAGLILQVGFKEYCQTILGNQYDSGKRGNHV